MGWCIVEFAGEGKWCGVFVFGEGRPWLGGIGKMVMFCCRLGELLMYGGVAMREKRIVRD
jgi:hypothetical protein